jgi:hypothetical protein
MTTNGGGYTFIYPNDIQSLTGDAVQTMFTDKTSFLMKVLTSNGSQRHGILKQLPAFRWSLSLLRGFIFAVGLSFALHASSEEKSCIEMRTE